jgi:hypothetical protein
MKNYFIFNVSGGWKMNSWEFRLGGVLLLISMMIYYIQVIIFESPRDTVFYLLQDLAFVPMQVLLITMLVNHMLGVREKKVLLKKLNMLVGVFFSEVGTDLIKLFFAFDRKSEVLKELLVVDLRWDDKQYQSAAKTIKDYTFAIDAKANDLNNLKAHLHGKRDFLLGLLANPNLLEHDTFTDLMWAVFHLAEELGQRESFEDLPAADYEHLSIDIDRVYSLLIIEWLVYMNYLRKDYPYLFSLAMRNNPFNDKASVIINDVKKEGSNVEIAISNVSITVKDAPKGESD